MTTKRPKYFFYINIISLVYMSISLYNVPMLWFYLYLQPATRCQVPSVTTPVIPLPFNTTIYQHGPLLLAPLVIENWLTLKIGQYEHPLLLPPSFYQRYYNLGHKLLDFCSFFRDPPFPLNQCCSRRRYLCLIQGEASFTKILQKNNIDRWGEGAKLVPKS